MRRRWLSRIGSVAVLALALALVSVGCAADRPPSADEDVSRALARQLMAEDFSSHAEITGTFSVGAIGGSFEGTMDVAGSDVRVAMEADLDGSHSRKESLTVDGVTYRRENDGAWVREPAPGAEEMALWLSTLPKLEFVGVERVDGENLHHLRPSPQPSPADLGIADEDVRYTDASVDFFADDRGTLKMMTVFLTGELAEDGPPAEMELRFRFAGPAEPIAAPEDVWGTFTSPSGATIAHPHDWTERSNRGVDVLRAPDGRPQVLLSVIDIPEGLRQDDAPEAFVRSIERQFGTRSNTVEFYEVDGTNGLLADMRPDGRDGTFHLMYFVGPRDGRISEVMWLGPMGIPDEERATFEDMLTTYTWPR